MWVFNPQFLFPSHDRLLEMSQRFIRLSVVHLKKRYAFEQGRRSRRRRFGVALQGIECLYIKLPRATGISTHPPHFCQIRKRSFCMTIWNSSFQLQNSTQRSFGFSKTSAEVDVQPREIA